MPGQTGADGIAVPQFLVHRPHLHQLPERLESEAAAGDDPLPVHKEQAGGLQDAVQALEVARDFRIPGMTDGHVRIGQLEPLRHEGLPGVPVGADIDGIERQVGLLLLQPAAQQDRLQPAFGAVSVIEIQDAPAVGRGRDGHRFLLQAPHLQHGGRGPGQRGPVEFRENPSLDPLGLGRESDGPGRKPAVVEVDGHGLLSHQGRIRIVGVEARRDGLPQQGVGAGLHQEVAFRQFRLQVLLFQGEDVSVDQRKRLRDAGGIDLRPQRKDGGQQTQEDEREPTHARAEGRRRRAGRGRCRRCGAGCRGRRKKRCGRTPGPSG